MASKQTALLISMPRTASCSCSSAGKRHISNTNVAISTHRKISKIYRALASGILDEDEVEIQSGRPHQIRIHLSFIGHPLMDKEHVEQISELSSTVNVALKTLDGRNESVDTCVAGSAFTVGKSPPQNGISAFERNSSAGGLGEGTPKSETSNDMFCDDIFGESPAGVRKTVRE